MWPTLCFWSKFRFIFLISQVSHDQNTGSAVHQYFWYIFDTNEKKSVLIGIIELITILNGGTYFGTRNFGMQKYISEAPLGKNIFASNFPKNEIFVWKNFSFKISVSARNQLCNRTFRIKISIFDRNRAIFTIRDPILCQKH